MAMSARARRPSRPGWYCSRPPSAIGGVFTPGRSVRYPGAARFRTLGGVQTAPAAVLTEEQRAAYEQQGWLAVPGLVDGAWLDRLRVVTAEFVEQSRALTESTVLFDLDAGHSAEEPRLRRLSSPTDLHETFWEFSSTSVIVDVVADLIGPNVKFHHSKLNFASAAAAKR